MKPEKHVVLCGKRIIAICEIKELADVLAISLNDNPMIVKILGTHTVEPISKFDFGHSEVNDFMAN